MNKKLKNLIFSAILLSLIPFAAKAVDISIYELKELLGQEQNLGATIIYPYMGGTGTISTPTADQMLIGGNNSRYDVKKLTAGSNITIATTSAAITISSTASGGGATDQLGQIGDVSTSTPMTYGEMLRYNTGTSKWESVATSSLGITGSGTVTSVAMSVPTGLAISGSPITTSGTLALTYAAGYAGVLTASTTEWATAYGWGDHSLGNYLSLTAWFATTTHSLINSLPALATVGTITTGTWQGLIYNDANPTINAIGKFGINTTTASSSLRWHDGATEKACYPEIYPAYNFATSTLNYFGLTATSSHNMANYYRPVTLLNVYCKSAVGTAFIEFGNGTATTTVASCTTSGTRTFFAANNTWTMNQDFTINVGTRSSSLGSLTVSAVIRQEAD